MLWIVKQERACARQETAASHDAFDLGFIACNRGGLASTCPETMVGAPGLSRLLHPPPVAIGKQRARVGLVLTGGSAMFLFLLD